MAYGAGGGSDRLFRSLQPFLEKELGQTLLPIYKPGAEGLIGFTDIVNTNPNGYFVGMLNLPAAIAPIVADQAQYKIDSFEYLGNVTYEPPLLVVAKNNKNNIGNLSDFVDFCKANPGKVTVGVSGIGSDEHIATRVLQKATGISLKVVPFDSTSAVAAAMLGGHIDAQMTSAFAIMNLIEQDQVISLGTGSENRSKEFPNIPTFKENGIDLVLGGLRGIVGPLNMPEEAKQAWIEAIKNLHKAPDYLESAAKSKTMLLYLDAEEFKEYALKLYEEYQDLWDEEPW